MVNVLIADDHSIVLYGVSLIVKELFRDSAITSVNTFDEVLDHVQSRKFDLLILDINMPSGDNVQMIDVIRLRDRNVKILIYTAYDEEFFAPRYLQAGVNGYLMKYSSKNDLRTAIETVMRDEIYCSRGMKQRLLETLRSSGKQVQTNPLSSLSSRETEVIQQLIKGLSISAISKMMSLQESTVSTYKMRVYKKLGVTNIIELAEKVKLYHN